MARKFVFSMILALVVSLGSSHLARAGAAAVTLTPASGGNGVPLIFGSAEFDLATVGYTESEFFVDGTADAYAPVGALTNDGKWTVTPIMPQPYTTRIIVRRPIDDREFNGTVVVEWFNVSGGADASPEWQHQHVEILRRGYAWVGVSAQWLGLQQLSCPTLGPGCPAPGDPVRYAPINHPGDSWSYDIFSQAGQAVWDQAGVVLDGLTPERLIAVGESQSAGRLTTYIDAAHPVVGVYDGFIMHSRGDAGSALSQSTAGPTGTPPVGTPTVPTPNPTYIRDDLGVPALAFQAENDLRGLAARQADTPLFRLWEVAGTAHFDQYGLVQAANDTGDRSTVAEWFDTMQNPTNNPSPNFSCVVPINTGPATFVNRAALRSMDRWIAEGEPPAIAPRLQTNGGPTIYDVDANGNVIGGIRTPAVDAPIARINGLGQPPGGLNLFCFLFGITIPFSDAQLDALYGSHGQFVSAWNKATQDAVQAGFLLREDAQQIRVVGAQSNIGK